MNTDQISSVDYGYVVFDFVDEQYPFQIDTDYCIAVGFVASGLLEGVSEILVGMDQTAPAHAGNVFAYMNGWSSQPGAYDLCFYVYGEPFTPPPPQVNITIMATLGGTTEPIPNTYSVVQNTDISVQAVPGVTLNHWELDGVNVGMANPHILLADMDHVLIAVFDQLVQTFLVALNSSPIQGIPFTIERIG
uniref:Bacterial repeat domain-containing protein n=1 Tax=viral metagenome TaxID=1070528 RepID=A0A6M3J5R0_9ZZZZ